MYKRLFLAITLPAPIKKILYEYHQSYSFDDVRWTMPEHLHITLYFFGDLDERVVPFLVTMLRDVFYDAQPFNLQFDKMRYFPNEEAPRMIWAQFTGGPQFEALVKAIDKIAQAFRQPGEQHPVRAPLAHVTLCRFKETPKEMPILKELDIEDVNVHRAQLLSSKLGVNGPRYYLVESFSLSENRIV